MEYLHVTYFSAPSPRTYMPVMIFATCGEGPGGHILNAIRPEGDSGTVAWSTKDATPYVPTPIIKGDLLFYWSDTGMVTCVHACMCVCARKAE